MLSSNYFKTKRIYKTPIIIASVVGFFNVIFSSSLILSNTLIFIELCVLFYYLFNQDIVEYFGVYLIFLSLSLEFDVFGNNIPVYGFKNFRILGVNLGILTLLPVLVMFFMKKKIKMDKIRKVSNKFYRFIIIIFLVNFIGILFGLIQILTNDNNIQYFNNVINIFLSEIYDGFGIIFLVVITFIYLISYNLEKINLLEDYLLATLVGVFVSIITSFSFGVFSKYGGVETLLGSNIKIYLPFLILFNFYYFKYNKIIFSLIGIISTLLLLFYNASGKLIILSILVLIGVFYILLINKKIKIYLLIFILLLSSFSLLIIFDLSIINFSQSIIFQSKLNQVKSLFSIWEPNWINKMPFSPRVRIIEFANIFYEYLQKPWFLLFGKGYLGTFKDHINMLTTFIPNSYSMQEWDYSTFYGMHETLNIMFLYHGILGLVTYIFIFKLVVLNLHKNPWILIGGFWFFMFYGYSVTLSAFGLSALIFGFIKIDYKYRGEKN